MRPVIAAALLALAMPLGANRAAPVAFAVDLSPATAYTVASYATGCPEWVLRGIHGAESSFGEDMNHPDPNDVGEYGLHETPEIHSERSGEWGEYDASDSVEASIIAGFIIMDALDRLGDMDYAIAAYRQGVAGVRRDGPTSWYVERVMNYGNAEG